MIFHISNISASHNSVNTIAKRLIDNLSARDIPAFRVDHFNNFQDGIFVILREMGTTPGFIKDSKVEVERAIDSVRNEFQLEYFHGHWIS